MVRRLEPNYRWFAAIDARGQIHD